MLDFPTDEDLRLAETIDPAVARQLKSLGGAEPPRDVAKRDAADLGFGERLLGRCPEGTRKKYRTLRHFDANAEPDIDFGAIIAYGSVLLELELHRLVGEPIHADADCIISAFPADKPRQAAQIAAWADGTRHTDLGTLVLILLAIHYGAQQQQPGVVAFLERQFSPRYRELISGDLLLNCLNRLLRYRNESCHGLRSFDECDYEAYLRKLLGSDRVFIWHQEGPDSRLIGDSAALHHHWQEWREPIPEARTTPIRKLLCQASATPAHPVLNVALHVEKSAGGSSPGQVGVLRRADRLQVQFNVTQDCHLGLIDVGAMGGLSVLWPNDRCPDTLVRGGVEYRLPSPATPSALPPAHHVGMRRIVALATLAPLEFPWLSECGDLFRQLGDNDIESLLHEITRLAPASWTLVVHEFQIKP